MEYCLYPVKSDALARLTSLTRSFIVINLVVILITFLAVTGVVKKDHSPALSAFCNNEKMQEKKTTRSVFPYYRKDEIGVLASSFSTTCCSIPMS